MSCKETNPKDVIGTQKAGISCVPVEVTFEVGLAMLEGAAKYGRYNYRAVGVRASVYYDAAMRHIAKWWAGQDIDPESGLPHLVKALSTLYVLRDAERHRMMDDDRPPQPRVVDVSLEEMNDVAAEILGRHADKCPRHYTIEDSYDYIFEEKK